MIIVHHLENSRSQRILWLLEELGLEYEIKFYARDPKTHLAPLELKTIHPLGKSPIITHHHRVIAESGAITEYLLSLSADTSLRPEIGGDDYWRYVYWMHFAEGSLMPPLVMRMVLMAAVDHVPFLIRPVLRHVNNAINKAYLGPLIESSLGLADQELEKGGWFAGSAFSAADIMMSFPIEAAQSRGGLGGRPNLDAWLRRIQARPAYQAALARGGTYAYARPVAA